MKQTLPGTHPSRFLCRNLQETSDMARHFAHKKLPQSNKNPFAPGSVQFFAWNQERFKHVRV